MVAEIALVEGSRLTPSVWLPPGHRKIVPWTQATKTLADKGFILVLARHPIALRSSECPMT